MPLTDAERRDLRQVATATAFELWLDTYADDGEEDDALSALWARNGGNVLLAAADLLEGVAEVAEAVTKFKLEGDLEVQLKPADFLGRAAGLRARDERAQAAALARPSLAGARFGGGGAPVFALTTGLSPSDRVGED